MTEIELDYLTDNDVWYVDIIAKAAKIAGTGTYDGLAWLITDDALPDEFLDADGGDAAVSGHVRAGSADGTVQYPLYIQQFTLNNDPALSVVRMWTNLGTIDADDAGGVPVRIFWNKAGKSQPAASDPYGSDAVFDDFTAFWPLIETPDGAAPQYADITANSNNASETSGVTLTDKVDLKYGSGLDFDAASTDGITVPHHSSLIYDATNGLSFGLWMQTKSPNSGFKTFISKRNDSLSPIAEWLMGHNQTTDGIYSGYYDGSFRNAVSTWAANFSNGTPYHLLTTIKTVAGDTTINFYKNGQLLATTTTVGSTPSTGTTPVTIGATKYSTGSTDEELNGSIAFPFIAQKAFTASQVETFYNNQNDNADFWDHTAAATTVGATGGETVTLGFDDVPVSGFDLSIDSLSITSVSPSEGAVGAEITILGGGFVDVLSVTLGGVEVDFTVVSPTEITFTVPEDAVSGNIVVMLAAVDETYSTFAVLPTVPLDGYHIEIYRIQVNVGETDIEIVDGTYKQYFTEGLNSEIDFIPISFSDFVRSVETEEGVYSLGSVDMSIEGLPADYFNDYTEYVYEPFIIVIRNAEGTTLFHGPIDPDTAVYDAGTKITAIRGLSWEVLLEATNSPCRYIYETVFTRDYSDAWVAGQNSTLYVKAEINGQDMTEIVQAGAVMVFDTPAGEHRSVVIGTTEDGDDLAVLINAPPTNYLLKDHEVTSPDISVISNVVSFVIANATLWSQLEQVENGQNMSLVVQNPTTQKLFVLGTTDTYPLNGSNAVFVLDPDRLTVKLIFSLPTVEVTDAIDTPFVSILSEGFVEAGESVRILGPDVYGYAPTGTLAIFRPYDIDGGVLQGLFALPELGVLPYIVDTFDFPEDYGRTLDKWVELPPRLLEALRQIQNTHYTFLNLEPRSEGGLPRITVIVRPRVAINTTDVPIVADVTNIISFRENAADLTPRAVIVKSHINYFEPTESVETVGFYYDGVDSADPKITGKPFGPRTVEITVNTSPSYTGEFFFGDGPIVRNDEKLKAIAKQFYNFYKGLARPCDFVVYGYPNEDWLGKFITISEIDDPLLETTFERDVFVTEVSVDPNTNTTSVRGRIGTYTDEEEGDPVVVVSGLLVWTDWDNSGDEQVVLSAIQSYDPQGDPVTVTWYDGATLLATGFTLIRTFDVGQYDITVRVTDPDSNFTEEILDLRVVAFVLFSATSEDDLALSYVTNGTFVPSNTAPTGSADTTGSLGEIRFDDTYVYVKTSAGWKRSALSTF